MGDTSDARLQEKYWSDNVANFTRESEEIDRGLD